MSALWTITAGGVERTLDAWGIRDPQLVFKSFSADELTFVVVRKNVLDAATFADGTTLTLRRDGVARFIGTVTSSASVGEGGGERESYLVSGPWYNLERLVYQQKRCLWSNASKTTKYTIDSAHVVIGQTSLGGRYRTTTAAMKQVLDFAFLRGAGIVAGSVAGGVDFPLEEARDLTCAEVLRRLGALTPDAVTWVDYSAGLPTLNFGRRSGLSAVSFDLLDADALVSWRVRARPDLVPAGVRFDFVRTDPADDGSSLILVASQTAGIVSGVGAVIATIQLDGQGDSQVAVPGGLATSYYSSTSAMQYEGQLVTQGRDCLGNVTVGNAVNLTGGRVAWATMRGVVQQVTEEILTGQTTIDFGPPERLSAEDFVDLMMFVRRKRESTNLQATMTCRRKGPDINDDGEIPDTGVEDPPGEPGEDNPEAGLSPEDTGPTVSLVACEGGQDVVYVVKGQRAS